MQKNPELSKDKESDYLLGSERKRYYKPDLDIKHDPFVIQAEDVIGPAPMVHSRTGFGLALDTPEKKAGSYLFATGMGSAILAMAYSRMEPEVNRMYPMTMSQMEIWRKHVKPVIKKPFLIPLSFSWILILGKYAMEKYHNRMDVILTGREVFAIVTLASLVPAFLTKNWKLWAPMAPIFGLFAGDYQHNLVVENYRYNDVHNKRKNVDSPYYADPPQYMKRQQPVQLSTHRLMNNQYVNDMYQGFDNEVDLNGIKYNSVSISHSNQSITERLNQFDQL